MGAYKDKLDLSISVAVGSSIQIAYVAGSEECASAKRGLWGASSVDSSSFPSRSSWDGSSANLFCESYRSSCIERAFSDGPNSIRMLFDPFESAVLFLAVIIVNQG